MPEVPARLCSSARRPRAAAIVRQHDHAMEPQVGSFARRCGPSRRPWRPSPPPSPPRRSSSGSRRRRARTGARRTRTRRRRPCGSSITSASCFRMASLIAARVSVTSGRSVRGPSARGRRFPAPLFEPLVETALPSGMTGDPPACFNSVQDGVAIAVEAHLGHPLACPDSSPLRQSRFRERDSRRVADAAVSTSASRLAPRGPSAPARSRHPARSR